LLVTSMRATRAWRAIASASRSSWRPIPWRLQLADTTRAVMRARSAPRVIE